LKLLSHFNSRPDHFFCHKIFLLFFATRGEIFSLKFTKYRSAAGLCQDPLGDLKRSPDPLATIRGPTSNGKGKEGREGRGGEEREEEGKPLLAGPLFKSRLRLWNYNEKLYFIGVKNCQKHVLHTLKCNVLQYVRTTYSTKNRIRRICMLEL